MQHCSYMATCLSHFSIASGFFIAAILGWCGAALFAVAVVESRVKPRSQMAVDEFHFQKHCIDSSKVTLRLDPSQKSWAWQAFRLVDEKGTPFFCFFGGRTRRACFLFFFS